MENGKHFHRAHGVLEWLVVHVAHAFHNVHVRKGPYSVNRLQSPRHGWQVLTQHLAPVCGSHESRGFVRLQRRRAPLRDLHGRRHRPPDCVMRVNVLWSARLSSLCRLQCFALQTNSHACRVVRLRTRCYFRLRWELFGSKRIFWTRLSVSCISRVLAVAVVLIFASFHSASTRELTPPSDSVSSPGLIDR